MTTQNNKDLALRMYQEFDKGNLEAVERFCATDFVAHVPGAPGPLNREAFKQFGRMFLSAFPDIHHVFTDVIAEGDKVVTVGTFNGTHKGALQGIPPTGKKISVPVIHVDRFASGKIVEHRGVADQMTLLQQLGVAPAPGQGT